MNVDPRPVNLPPDDPNKKNIPRQPEVYPPGDKPLSPPDPNKQPIAIH